MYANIPYSSFGSPVEKQSDKINHRPTAIAFGDIDINSRPSKRIAQYFTTRFIACDLG